MSRYYQKPPPPPIQASKILYSLSLAKPALLKLREQDKPYEPLIEAILAIGPDDKTPASKTLQERLGITAGKFRKWLDTLHQDFLEAIAADADVLQFGNVEHLVCVRGKREYVTFLCRLPITPRVGEGMELWFLRGAAGEGTYYVEDVNYEWASDKVTVTIHVRPGYFDAYFWHLRARARFEGKLSYELEDQLGEYGTKDYLRKLYDAPRQPVPPPYTPSSQNTTRRRRGQWG